MLAKVPNPTTDTTNFERRRSFAIGAKREGFRAGSKETYNNQNIITIAPGADIQRAIDTVHATGGGKVILLNGVHEPVTDIAVKDNVILEGENPAAAIIDFGGQFLSVRVVGEDVYSTGTVAVTENTTTVTGTGTVWNADMVGQDISLEGVWYEVTAVNEGAQTLTIDEAFFSTSGNGNLSGASYAIATLRTGVQINNLTIQNSTSAAVQVEYADVISMDLLFLFDSHYGLYANFISTLTKSNGGCDSCDYGYYIYYCDGFSILSDFVFNTLVGDGCRYTNSGDATFFNSSTSGCVGNGQSFVNAYNMGILSFTSNSNTGHGFELISGNNDISIISGVIGTNGGDGVKLTATSDRNQIAEVSCRSNTGYGIDIAAASCDNNLVSACALVSNTAGQINNSGTTTKLRGCIGSADIG